MAARQQAMAAGLVPLRHVEAAALMPLLEEEKARWLGLLHWDFTASSELVLRYASMQAMEGFALMDGPEAVGYVYWVLEEHKGLIGDLYVRNAWRSPENENVLLAGAIGEMRRNPWIRRVEAQLMHLAAKGSQVTPAGLRPQSYPRHFMMGGVSAAAGLRAWNCSCSLRFEPWSMRWLNDAAELIAEVYADHIDSQINDQYHTPNGARRFLQNIVQYPGCGQFAAECSWVAVNGMGQMRGLCLSSMVHRTTGHIAQICLGPELRGLGGGYELLRRGIVALAEAGAVEVSLTATSSNQPAIRLYERFGLRAIYEFEAMVWDRLWP
ncbi:MAG: GNAT family N-acetyltransferase [Acidobacteria bacterium]|nr:GNAT family N-acetyltransferase [Acidobacteriota bacterium]